MKKTWKPVAAGVVSLVVGIPVSIFYPFYLLYTSLSGQDISPAALLIMLIGLPAIVGGLLVLRRQFWRLVLIALILSIPSGHLTFLGLSAMLHWIFRPFDIEVLVSVIPFIGSGLVVAATILAVLSQREFVLPRLASEE